MGDVTWAAAVGVIVPILVAGFGLLWQMGDRQRREIDQLRSELRAEMSAGFADVRQAVTALTEAHMRHLEHHAR
ncbi:MAG TPA: hypothetical protein VEA78_11445 [Acidimicrobiales bacterium]|nr:hypothetical protein [Acidimicrobiales bacterium]